VDNIYDNQEERKLFSLASPWQTRATSALAAGLVASGVGLLALTGCSSGGSGNSAASGSAAPSGASSQPSWASSLGAGVTVSQPSSPSPGNDSPGAAVAGEIAAVTAKNMLQGCQYYTPVFQAQCKAAGGGSPTDVPTFTNSAIGYVAVNGQKALVGITGKICTPRNPCFTNTDPAAIFKDGKSFAQQWDAAVKAGSSGYSLSPCVQVGGKWYIFVEAHPSS
jgi:hypothetical protein